MALKKLFSTTKAEVYLLNQDLAQPLQDYLLCNEARLAPTELNDGL